MSDDINNDATIKRKPGRPKKAENEAKQHRQIFYVVVGLNKDLEPNSSEEFCSTFGATEDELKKYTPEYILKHYQDEKKWTLSSCGIYGPFHKVKGLVKRVKPQASSVSKDTKFGVCLGEAEHDGWHGAVFAVKDRSDVVCFVPINKTSSKFLTKEISLVPKSMISISNTNESKELTESLDSSENEDNENVSE